jgi:hypothetical protein
MPSRTNKGAASVPDLDQMLDGQFYARFYRRSHVIIQTSSNMA